MVVITDDNDCDDNVINTDQLMTNDYVWGNEELVKPQLDDDSLIACWEMAQLNKGNLLVDYDLLYYTDQVEG